MIGGRREREKTKGIGSKQAALWKAYRNISHKIISASFCEPFRSEPFNDETLKPSFGILKPLQLRLSDAMMPSAQRSFSKQC